MFSALPQFPYFMFVSPVFVVSHCFVVCSLLVLEYLPKQIIKLLGLLNEFDCKI